MRLIQAHNQLSITHTYTRTHATFFAGEGQTPTPITYSELRHRVAGIAEALKGCGVGRGDRVVGYLPNSSLAVEAMLATASLGAVWSSTSPDFGVTVRDDPLPTHIVFYWRSGVGGEV